MMKHALLTLLFATLSFPASADIKIGVAVPLSGVYASLGKQIVNGATIAASEINEAGGIGDDQIVIEAIDDKCDPQTASNVANQLVGRGVIIVIGHLCDRPSIEASTVYAENKIVQISPASQNPSFTENRPLETGGTYRLAARNTQQAEVLTNFITTAAQGQKVAILNDGSVYGKGLADAILAGLKGSNVTPALIDSFEPGEERYRSLSTRVIDSGADLVFIGGVHLDSATLIRDLDRLSDSLTIVGGDGLVHPNFPKLVLESNPNRENLAGIFTTFPPDPRLLPTAKNTVVRLKKAEINPAGLVLRGYAAMKIIESAIRREGSKDFEPLTNAFNKGKFQTPLGTISFNGKGDANLVDYAIHTWENGTIVPVN